MYVDTDGLTNHQQKELARVAAEMRAMNDATGPMAAQACESKGRDFAVQQLGRPVTEEVTLENVDELMRYQPWDRDQLAAGDVVRETLTAAVKAILRHVPACPTRSEVVHDLVNARMKANAAISFRGRF